MSDLILLTENALGISGYSELVKFVTMIFIVMFIGIVLFFLFTLCTLALHQISKKYNSILHKRYSSWLISYLLEPDSPAPNAPLHHRRAFRTAILDLVLITKGQEKSTLLKIYISSGLWENDLQLLKNVFWYRRLAALVRLDQWQFCLGKENLSHLMNDENFQIRQIAIKNLSRTKDPEEATYLLDLLTKVKTNYSALYESIYRMIRIHRELVIESLNIPERSKLWPYIVKVIGDSRIIEAVPSLIQIAHFSDNAELREKSIISLGQIGDPRGLEILKDAVKSPYSKERLAAVKSLYQVDFEELKSYEHLLANDPDADVKSWMNHLMKGGR